MTGRGRVGLNCLRLASRARLTTADPGRKLYEFQFSSRLRRPQTNRGAFLFAGRLGCRKGSLKTICG